jgi:hypothetical protein
MRLTWTGKRGYQQSGRCINLVVTKENHSTLESNWINKTLVMIMIITTIIELMLQKFSWFQRVRP